MKYCVSIFVSVCLSTTYYILWNIECSQWPV